MVSNQDATSSSTTLEARLRSQTASAMFARLASHYLDKGNPLEAFQLCREGLKHHPGYSTGHFILGKSCEALGRTMEALVAYRNALKALPDNPTIQQCLNRAERLEQDRFRAYAQERASHLQQDKHSTGLEEHLAAPVQHVPPPPEEMADERSRGSEPSIVTATMAEIYAMQGEYRMALKTYRKLVAQQPENEGKFSKKIAELELLEEPKRKTEKASR